MCHMNVSSFFIEVRGREKYSFKIIVSLLVFIVLIVDSFHKSVVYAKKEKRYELEE